MWEWKGGVGVGLLEGGQRTLHPRTFCFTVLLVVGSDAGFLRAVSLAPPTTVEVVVYLSCSIVVNIK